MLMKKIVTMMLALMLSLSGLALAAGTRMTGEVIEDGSYVIRIPVAAGDEGWVADDMAQDDSVVKLAKAQIVDGQYTAIYVPVADGEIDITVKHMDGIACDQVYGYSMKVVNGVIDVTGGSYTASPAEAELDAVLSGEWQVNAEAMASATFTKNDGKGWAFLIGTAYPGVYVFKGNCYYDCELNAFVYSDATIYQSEITNTPEVKLGDVIAENASGSFTLVEGQDGFMNLEWYNGMSPDEKVTFGSMKALTAMEEQYAEDAGSDWYMKVLTDEAITAEFPCRAFVDVNGDGVPALFVATTDKAFIGDADRARLYLCRDGEAELAMEIGGGAGDEFFCNPQDHTITHYSRMSGERHIEVYTVENGALAKQLTADSYAPHHYPEADTEEGVYLRNGEKITEAECDALFDQYVTEENMVACEAQ